MSAMGETKYLLQAHAGRNLSSQPPQDLTPCPYSAVSSFNLPSYCDSTLITPISMSQSPTVNTKTAPAMRTDKDIKLSPSMMSPTYQFLADEDYNSGRYSHNPPMKHKSPSGTLHMSTLDSSFPASPYACPEPFFGAYGVSATPVSGRSESSLSLNRSPAQVHSAGGLSNSSSSHSRGPTPAQNASAYRSHIQAPILIAPNPSTLRPATTQEGGSYRQNSLQSISTAPSSDTVAQGPFPEPRASLPARGKKRKSPGGDSREKDMVFAEDKTANEELLLELSHRQQLPWKDVQRLYNEKTGTKMNIAALQMRKKRLIERIRVWTDDDERALTLAVEEFDKNRWETIADSMLRYGCIAKWSKEMCQKKWREMHPDDGSYPPQYEMLAQYRDSDDWGPNERAFSDGKASICHSLHEGDSGVQMSAISSTTMEEVRSRAASDASSQMFQMRRQHRQQQQMIFDQQHNGWGAER